MDRKSSPLTVALQGMDARSSKMMAMYLQGPCKGEAVVISDGYADALILDADSMSGQAFLKTFLAEGIEKPLILISLHETHIENVICIKKPVKTDDMLMALSQIKSRLSQRKQHEDRVSKAAIEEYRVESEEDFVTTKPNAVEAVEEKPVLKSYVIRTDEQLKTSKHQAAMQLNEKAFVAFIGNVPGLDVNDPRQFSKANYNAKHYFQGYVESAFNVSRTKGQARQLNSGWNPLLIFPEANEIWIDVDENQLRAFAGLLINSTLGASMSVTPLSQELVDQERILEKYQSMDAFLWKIACWASKGRYPHQLDIRQPIFLKHWPNFTRLLVTPHALRISALMIKGPRTLPNIAEVLNIKPQYVFIFASSAYALGLIGHAKRDADVLFQPPEIKPNKNQSILGRIISTLLGKKA